MRDNNYLQSTQYCAMRNLPVSFFINPVAVWRPLANNTEASGPGPNQPYLCPESRLTVTPGAGSINASSISYEWPVTFVDTVEWVQHPEKTGVFFHEENIFSLWTMKIMDFDAQ